MPEVRVLTDVLTRGGESPVWDLDEQRLYWVDNVEGHVFRSTADGRELTVWTFPRQVTAIARAAGDRLIVASGRRLFRFDLDTGERDELYRSDDEPVSMFNDGKVDRQGRFVIGTADVRIFDPDSSKQLADGEPAGRLYRLDPDRTVTPLVEGLGITNGPCFSGDGAVLYCNDSSAQRCTYAYDYDTATGRASHRRVLIRFDERATPDGATVDEDGYLWIANFTGGEIRRYSPDGALDRSVALPVASPTSVMFGGPELDILFVTSQAEGHLPAGMDVPKAGPLAGRVFAIHGLGVRGLPERRFAG